MAKAFGKMDAGLVNQVSKANKNYDNEILAAGVNSFMSAAKPTIEKFAVVQKKFDGIMESFTEASQIPTASAEERENLQPVVDATSKEAQDFARMYAENPSNLEAQAGFQKAVGKMNRITASQTELYKNKAEAKVVFDNNSFSVGQTEGDKNHGMAIISGSGFTESYDDIGYKTYKMDDGAIYDNNPNTDYPPPPKIESTFTEGQTAMLKSWNTNVGGIKDKDVNQTLKNFNSEATSSTLLNDIMTSGLKADGTPGAPPSYAQQMDLLFSDISGDNQSVTYADMWIQGGLDPSFYEDDNGNEITDTRGITFSNLPKDQREALLRDKTRGPNNMKNLAKFYSNTMKSGLEQKSYDVADENGTLIMNADPTSTAKPFIAKNKKEADAVKTSQYVDMTLGNLNLTGNFSKTFMEGESPLEDMFKNSSYAVEQVNINPDEDGAFIGGIEVVTKRGLDGEKRDAKTLVFDPNNASDMRAFKKLLSEDTDIFENLNLGSNPGEWTNFNGELMIDPVGNKESVYSMTPPFVNGAIENDYDPTNDPTVVDPNNRPDYLKNRNSEKAKNSNYTLQNDVNEFNRDPKNNTIRTSDPLTSGYKLPGVNDDGAFTGDLNLSNEEN